MNNLVLRLDEGSPVRLSAEASWMVEAGVPSGTRRAYAAGREDWRAFCDDRGEQQMPVDPRVLVEYVAQLLSTGSAGRGTQARPLHPTTVEGRLSAITTWSRECGYGTPDLRAARLALRGHRREVASGTSQAAPLTVAALRTLLAAARDTADGPDSSRALRDGALVRLGFALGARRSELVRVCIEHVRIESDGLIVQVHRAKTRDLPDEVAVPWAADEELCAGRAVLRLRTRLARDGFRTGPLFRQVRRGDHMQPQGLAPQAVADILQRLAEEAGLPIPDGFRGWSGHSLRRGFATEARRAGADALRIARHGGWADNSAALATYLVDVDQWHNHPLAGVL